MSNVVKLILTCQVRDDYIPQLIPLMWVFSIIICLLLFSILINLYYYRDKYHLDILSINDKNMLVNIIW